MKTRNEVDGRRDEVKGTRDDVKGTMGEVNRSCNTNIIILNT